MAAQWRTRRKQKYPSSMSTTNTLATLYLSKGVSSDANPLLKHVLEVERAMHGKALPASLAHKNNNLAMRFHKNGYLAAAQSRCSTQICRGGKQGSVWLR